MLMRIILIKLTLYLTEKYQNRKSQRLMSWQNHIKIKINTPQKSENFNSVTAASTAGPCPTIISLLLQFCDNVHSKWQLCRP